MRGLSRRDDALRLQQGEDPRHGFDGQPEIVADADARHRQFHLAQAALRLCHVEQEGRDALDGVLAAREGAPAPASALPGQAAKLA